MKFRCILLLFTACLGGAQAQAQAGAEAPRQLGGAPVAASAPVVRDSVSRPVAAGGYTGRGGAASHFGVGLKTGSVLSATDVAAYYPLLERPYLLLNGQNRLALTEVSYYENETGYYRRARPWGGLREVTLHRVLAGRLSVYEPRTAGYRRLAMGSALLAMGSPLLAATSTGLQPSSRGYFAKDEGTVYTLTHGHLRRAISDNPAALTLETSAYRYEVVNTASAVVGMGLLLGGILRGIGHLGGSDLNGNLTLGMLGASVPILVVPLVLKDKPAEQRRGAIELYNYAKR